jgi:hypothetical protein
MPHKRQIACRECTEPLSPLCERTTWEETDEEIVSKNLHLRELGGYYLRPTFFAFGSGVRGDRPEKRCIAPA